MNEFVMDKVKSDDDGGDYISLDSSDEDENFSTSMSEETSLCNKKSALFDEVGASKSLKAYASSIDYQKDKVLTTSGLNIAKKIFP